MPPSAPGWGGIWENSSYEDACYALCETLGIERRTLDDITQGLMWALGENPLQFQQIGDTNA